MIQAQAITPISEPEPAWEVATLFPPQGQWSEGEYLALTDDTRRLVELVDGRIEVLPMPTFEHQLTVGFLYRTLYDFVSLHDLGWMVVAALRVHVRDDSFREPDIVFMAKSIGTAPVTAFGKARTC